GKILINLDSEDEGQIFIGCAGGKNTLATFSFTPEAAPARSYFTIVVTGLNGGHSGGDIHKGLGNANKLLARFLYDDNQKEPENMKWVGQYSNANMVKTDFFEAKSTAYAKSTALIDDL
ncbi:MAG: cytosol nonspecific dipeptidase, partial [Segatella oulorum]